MSIKQIADEFGGMAEMAKALGVSTQAVYQWKVIPPLRALQIERLTSGRISAAKMNPGSVPGQKTA